MKKFETLAEIDTVDIRHAILEADTLVRANPKLQGIILRRPEQAYDPVLDYTKDSSKKLETGEVSRPGIETFTYLMYNFKRNTGYIPELSAALGLLGREKGLADIDPLRRAEIDVLSSMFHYVEGEIRFEHTNSFSAHFDATPNKQEDIQHSNPERLFHGRLVRYLRSRKGPGVLVFDNNQGITLNSYEGNIQVRSADKSKAIPIDENDILLFFTKSWEGRGLAHSSPDFQASAPGEFRNLDTITLSQGRFLKEIYGMLKQEGLDVEPVHN